MKPGIQMPMLSATILLEALNPVELFMENSMKILVKVEQQTQDAIAKFYVAIDEKKERDGGAVGYLRVPDNREERHPHE
jgi:hypothetical protein